MKIEISISKDLSVIVNVDNELIEPKKNEKLWEFSINKKWVWEKAMDELEKQNNM